MKKNMSPEKSIEIITQMIAESKHSYKHHSFYFLLWGWLMIIAALSQYVLINMDYKYSFLPWLIFSCIGGLISAIKGRKENNKLQTYSDRVISYTWVGFVITMIITLIAVVPDNPNPFVLLLGGLATFITGGITKFKWFIIGGIIFWIAAIVSFQVDVQLSLLIYAVAMFLGYIVPGYALRSGK
jgi:hypothetical protein